MRSEMFVWQTPPDKKKMTGEDLVNWLFMGLIAFVFGLVAGAWIGAFWQAARGVQ